ncbi:MAG: lipoyl synthase [Pseudomonadales bacterium]|nr:lipoyl synthase [Pseudomonadales bacterium]
MTDTLNSSDSSSKPSAKPRKRKARVEPGVKQRGQEKMARIPVKIEPTENTPRKPDWLRIRLPASNHGVQRIKSLLRKQKLATVCEEASCPNLHECFSSGTATFMIMGEICTRRCPFCDVAHGRPLPLDENEAQHLAESIAELQLRYVVITSVDRDDLRDGGAQHFVDCIEETRKLNPNTGIEVLVPDFRGRMEVALDILSQSPPDVFNHNLETAPRLYKALRPGSDYQWSLDLLKNFKQRAPNVATKSGLMLGLGETIEEIESVMADLRAHDVDMLTLGQYLQPSRHHAPVKDYVRPEEFDRLGELAKKMGFSRVASGPLVRSSYHADKQYLGEKIS